MSVNDFGFPSYFQGTFSRWIKNVPVAHNGDKSADVTGTVGAHAFVFGLLGLILMLIATPNSDVNVFVVGIVVVFGCLGALTGWLWVQELNIDNQLAPKSVVGIYLYALFFVISAIAVILLSYASGGPNVGTPADAVLSGVINGNIALAVGYFIDRGRLMKSSQKNAHQMKPHSTETKSELLATIERLAELHKQGILTDEEFQEKKMQILDSI
jgi:hypothetical protein